MVFQPGKSGNPLGRAVEKPFRDALRMEIALAEAGKESPAKPGTLRWIARGLLTRGGADNVAAIAVADRLDGKPAQSVEMSGGLEIITHEAALDELDDGPGTDDPPPAA